MKWLKRLAERYLEKSYEGPDMPPAFVELAVLWANARPRATRAEWLGMALDLARAAHRDGFIAGFEGAERAPKPWQVGPSPEEVADAAMPGWRDAVAAQLVDPTMPPTAEPLAEDVLTDDMLKRYARAREAGDDDDDDDPG